MRRIQKTHRAPPVSPRPRFFIQSNHVHTRTHTRPHPQRRAAHALALPPTARLDATRGGRDLGDSERAVGAASASGRETVREKRVGRGWLGV